MLVVGAACSSSNPSCSQEERCSGPADCPSGQYCASGCCLLGCDEDSDCRQGSFCDVDSHHCSSSDGIPPVDGSGGGDQADAGADGGSDSGADTGGDAGADLPGDPGGGDGECQPTHDHQLGQSCNCDDECAPEAPFCFADVMNDPGPLYCTIPNCTAGSCPQDYQCNDFYVNADPPQPPFCQKCLGGQPRGLGETCLCDSDCGPDAPDCFRDITDAAEPPAICTITGCTVGEGDQCPGSYECSVSMDMSNQDNPVVNFCKPCDPGDGSLPEGAECTCNKDCAGNAICTKDIGSEEPRRCVACLGGEPRGFGETCECDSDCGPDFPTCLVNSNYCSILGCLDDPNIVCPNGSTCQDVFGMFSYCKKN